MFWGSESRLAGTHEQEIRGEWTRGIDVSSVRPTVKGTDKQAFCVRRGGGEWASWGVAAIRLGSLADGIPEGGGGSSSNISTQLSLIPRAGEDFIR